MCLQRFMVISLCTHVNYFNRFVVEEYVAAFKLKEMKNKRMFATGVRYSRVRYIEVLLYKKHRNSAGLLYVTSRYDAD